MLSNGNCRNNINNRENMVDIHKSFQLQRKSSSDNDIIDINQRDNIDCDERKEKNELLFSEENADIINEEEQSEVTIAQKEKNRKKKYINMCEMLMREIDKQMGEVADYQNSLTKEDNYKNYYNNRKNGEYKRKCYDNKNNRYYNKMNKVKYGYTGRERFENDYMGSKRSREETYYKHRLYRK